MANTYLGVSTTSSGTRTKWTTSFWVKRSNLSNKNIIFGSYLDSSNNDVIRFNTDGTLQFWSYQSSSYSNGGHLKTNRLFRDTNAWYHIVCRWDSNNSTADDRMKIWVNGVEETSFSSRTNPTSGRESLISLQGYTTIGKLGSDYFDGCLSHVHFCDNQLYQASDFGEYDANGVWKIITQPSVSYGTTGYFILKDGNSVTDQSGNGNNFTVGGGTLTNTEDSPSNVFATLNPLIPMRGTPTYQSGNTYFRSNYSNWDSALSTIGATSGKWYFEAKWGGQENLMIGCVDVDKNPEFLSAQGTYGYVGYKGISYFGESGNPRVIGNNNSDLYTGLTTFASGDIIGCAIDLDNQEMFVHRNGTYTNSGNPETRANPYDMSTSINQGGHVLMGVASRVGYGVEVNFGNGYFSSTAVSSAGTNASGNGIFEYDVPTGYTALSTKGLNL